MQQAKCSPNGCNYDRSAVDLINGLRADTWNMFTITNNTIDQVKQQIMADMMSMVTELNQKIDANTVKNDLLKIRKNLLTPTSAKMLLFQDVFLLILVCPTTN